MCLSVYLGTSRALPLPAAGPGELALEHADWTPSPLKRREFVYYVGQKTQGSAELGCSCLLRERVEWAETDPIIHQDETYPVEACAFEALRQLCDEATRDGGLATIFCDDSSGVGQDWAEDDYCGEGLIRLASIARGNLIFADASGGVASRVCHVVR